MLCALNIYSYFNTEIMNTTVYDNSMNCRLAKYACA
jgi:hypothetical protein